MDNLIGKDLGRYHILEQLGEGGMASVYKAYDLRLERDVAVKIIRIDQFAPSVLDHVLKRFERESKALARLTHPNIVHVNDFGEQEGIPYLVMDFLPGKTLKQRMDKPVPWQQALRLILPIAHALEYAHQHNILHRDIKPSNILLTENGQPMLSDFGIAKILESEESITLTGTGVGIGTPEYMAPEQWTGQASHLSDLYSLGVVLYELVAGRKPYSADTPAAILLKQASEPLPRPTEFAPDLPEAIEKMLFKALAKKPEERYQNMGLFATALEDLLLSQAGQPAEHGSASMKAIPPALEPPRPEQARPDSEPQDAKTMDAGIAGVEQASSQPTLIPLIPLAISQHAKAPEGARPRKGWLIAGVAITVLVVAGLVVGIVTSTRKPAKPANQSAAIPTDNAVSPIVLPTETKTALGSPTNPPTITPKWLEFASADFLALPKPNRVLNNLEGVWEMFSNTNGVSSIIGQGGLMWAATGGGVVAWDLGSGNFKYYTVYDGLNTNTISSLALTPQNELWAGSWENGISRFNGSHWETLDSQGLSIIWDVTNDGSIWATSQFETKLGRYLNGKWQIYTTENGLPSDARYFGKVIADPKGGLWVQTSDDTGKSKISYFKDGVWNSYSNGLPDQSSVLGVSSESKLWLLVSGKKIGTYDGSTYTDLATLPDGITGYPVSGVTMPDGTLTFSIVNDKRERPGLFYLKGNQLDLHTTADGLPNNQIYGIFNNSQGLWISIPEGIARMIDDSSWQIYSTTGDIASGEIRSIQIDNSGSVWCATLGGGVSQFDGKKWSTYTKMDGLADDYLWSIEKAPDGKLWVGTWVTGMVSSYDGSSWHSYGTGDGLNAGGYVWTLGVSPTGSVWAGTANGVAVFNGGTWNTYVVKNDQSLKDVRSIAFSANGDVWIGTEDYSTGGKVARLSGSEWTIFDKGSGLNAGTGVGALATDGNGNLFAGTYNGLFKFVANKWEAIPESPGYINDIAFAKDGSLWVATEFNGIQEYIGSTWKQAYGLGKGMPGFRMATIAIAADNSIWAGGQGGAIKFTPASSGK